MAKILVIPDVHGSHQWEVVKSNSPDSYDYAVFLGDYFDSWENDWPDQGENFKAICNFVREDPAHRKMVIGNHDWSYISGTRDGYRVSGHQSGHILEIRNLLEQNLDIIDLAFECDGWVFSHAGFSDTWIKSIKKCFHSIFDVDGYEWTETDFSVDFINRQFHSFSHSPEDDYFFYEFDELLDWYGFFSPSGDEISQGPLWIRPESLLQDAYYPKQVVGHTEMCLYEKVFLHQKENKVVVADSALHEVYSVFDTSTEYSFITIQEFFKWYKNTLKIINDIKSQIIYHKDATDFILTSLKEHFPEDITAKLYKNAFKDYLEK